MKIFRRNTPHDCAGDVHKLYKKIKRFTDVIGNDGFDLILTIEAKGGKLDFKSKIWCGEISEPSENVDLV